MEHLSIPARLNQIVKMLVWMRGEQKGGVQDNLQVLNLVSGETGHPNQLKDVSRKKSILENREKGQIWISVQGTLKWNCLGHTWLSRPGL